MEVLMYIYILKSGRLYIIKYAVTFAHVPFKLFSFQVSVLADDILKNVEYDALRVVFNKFQSVVSFIPTTATVLSPEVMKMLHSNKFALIFFFSFPCFAFGYKMLCDAMLM